MSMDHLSLFRRKPSALLPLVVISILVLLASCISPTPAPTPSATQTLAAISNPIPAITASPTPTASLTSINHVIVIYQENWSFDGLYGKFPGANGLANAGDTIKQVDKNGKPYASLPQPIDTSANPSGPNPKFPKDTPVAPFDLSAYVPLDAPSGNLIHQFYHEQLQIDGGKMDKFAAWSDNPGLVMAYFDAADLPEGKLAQEYTLQDNLFHSAFGGSFLNHVYLISAAVPVWPNAPADMVAVLDSNGVMQKNGTVTPDGYAVNTAYSMVQPYPASAADPTRRMPLQTMKTIGDSLSEKGVSWAWYSGGWNDANSGKPDRLFQFHHQPFNYFEKYAGGPERAEHLKDISGFTDAIKNGTLPAVSFVKPLGKFNAHPSYSGLLESQQYVADLVKLVRESPYWKDSVIYITYDENGGRWDHVAPPVIDRWGPGARVPGIVISPYAKKHFVDHTQYETLSIIKFIEVRWSLKPLGTRDINANNILNSLDFSQKP